MTKPAELTTGEKLVVGTAGIGLGLLVSSLAKPSKTFTKSLIINGIAAMLPESGKYIVPNISDNTEKAIDKSALLSLIDPLHDMVKTLQALKHKDTDRSIEYLKDACRKITAWVAAQGSKYAAIALYGIAKAYFTPKTT